MKKKKIMIVRTEKARKYQTKSVVLDGEEIKKVN